MSVNLRSSCRASFFFANSRTSCGLMGAASRTARIAPTPLGRSSDLSGVLEEQVHALVIAWTKLVDDVAREVFAHEIGRKAAAHGFFRDDLLDAFAAVAAGLHKRFGDPGTSHRVLPPGPHCEHHRQPGHLDPFGA